MPGKIYVDESAKQIVSKSVYMLTTLINGDTLI